MSPKPIKTEIQDFAPKKQFLVLFDSDGCVIDSMIKKHTLCFAPLMISEWGLTEHEGEITELWKRVNLYSPTRGLNRFRALATVLKEVNERYHPIVGIGNLLHWCESDELSEASLIRKLDANRDVGIFKKALDWSRRANAAAERMQGEFTPFSGARIALDLASRFADIAVVSGADPNALYGEWTGFGLMEHVDLLLGQNAGKKEAIIAKLLEVGYDKSRVLMFGDSPFDLLAARTNRIHFFPILAGKEEESWRAAPNALERFKNGRFEEIQDGLIKNFNENLNGGTNNDRP